VWLAALFISLPESESQADKRIGCEQVCDGSSLSQMKINIRCWNENRVGVRKVRWGWERRGDYTKEVLY